MFVYVDLVEKNTTVARDDDLRVLCCFRKRVK
jgi:hypothetical protein